MATGQDHGGGGRGSERGSAVGDSVYGRIRDSACGKRPGGAQYVPGIGTRGVRDHPDGYADACNGRLHGGSRDTETYTRGCGIGADLCMHRQYFPGRPGAGDTKRYG